MNAPTSPGRAVPLVAYSLCCALGATLEQARAALFAGRTGLRAPDFELPFRTLAGVVADPLPSVPERLHAYDTRQARLALSALEPLLPALERSVQRFGRARVGAVFGSSNGGLDRSERGFASYLQGGVVPADYSLRTQHDFAAPLALLRALTGIEGPAHVVSSACASSGKAFASASRMLATGIVDAVLVAGVDALCELTLRGFRGLGVLEEQACRPFGQGRRGINVGEGAAMFLLERDADAPFALLGAGESSDAHHMTAPHPDGEGAERAMRLALEQSGLCASDIDLINAHGTGTLQGDAAEAAAIERVFGREASVVSTKAYTGHTLGAAGAVDAALCLLSLEHGRVPASLGAFPVDPDLPIRIVRESAEIRCRHVLSNSFAFGGSNVSVVFGARA